MIYINRSNKMADLAEAASKGCISALQTGAFPLLNNAAAIVIIGFDTAKDALVFQNAYIENKVLRLKESK